ncbi:KDGP aldolase [Pectinatus frisingensis]|uniref:KDGP aldolase n=1 Tax=Pectinatus frisingensis TaxID=865 RepID=UPI0018C73E67|nr:KDGP aldolase [Pectinatus frisingensis]
MTQIKLNVLAADIKNAKEIVDATNGNVYIGVMVKSFASVDEAVRSVNEMQAMGIPVSVGLGGADPAMWSKVADTAIKTKPVHVNQVYPGAGYTIAALRAVGSEQTIVNALVKPSGIAGKVSILTGPMTQNYNEYISCAAAAAALSELNIPSVKFYPIGGDKHLGEVAAMVKAAVKAGITMFEPTGGINGDSVSAVVKTCLENGAEIIVPHIYTAFVDKNTGRTEPQKVAAVLERLHSMI